MDISKNKTHNIFAFFIFLIVTMLIGTMQANAAESWPFYYNGTDGSDGSIQTFTVPESGEYKLEVWGAEGGGSYYKNSTTTKTAKGGPGGYSVGTVYLTKGQVLYIVVGGKGGTYGVNTSLSVPHGGYNGGGAATTGSTGTTTAVAGGGGGATHIATRSGLLSSLNGYRSNILIVAGGGGGASYEDEGGSAGGYRGNPGKSGYVTHSNIWLGSGEAPLEGNGGEGATQTTGYAFGQGQSGSGKGGSNLGVAGGGGGFFGGYTNLSTSGIVNTGGGGSGYIANASLMNKVMHCYYCDYSLETDTYTDEDFDAYEAATTNYPKLGNGHVLITKTRSSNTQLDDIKVDNVSIADFDPAVRNYTVYVNQGTTSVTILATKKENAQIVTYPSNLTINGSGTRKAITVTAEDGTIGAYTLTFQEADEKLASLSVTGGTLSPAFSSDVFYYDVKMESSTSSVNISATTIQSTTKITSGIGPQSIENSRDIQVKTLSPTGAIASYNLHFQNSNTQLLDIKVNGSSISGFTPGTRTYNVYVPYEATAITAITATKMEEAQTVILPTNMNLTGATTTKVVSVTAEDGTVGAYTINIIKADPRLATLAVSSGTLSPAFSPDIYEYDVKVNPTISSVNVTATTVQEKTQITSGTGVRNIGFGNTDMTVTTRSVSNDERTYTLHLKKTEVYLNDIKVNGTSIADFVPANLSYTVHVPHDSTSITLEAVKGDEKQVIIYPKELDLTNVVTTKVISVTAEDGTVTNYIIRLDKDDERLSNINVTDSVFITPFSPDIYEYDVVADIDATSVKISADPLVTSTTVSGIGSKVLSNGTNDVTLTTLSETGRTKSYVLHIIKSNGSLNGSYSYNAKPQVFVVPKTGIYKLETWGAVNGSNKGGYVSGHQHLNKGEILYIYTGKTGSADRNVNSSYITKATGVLENLSSNELIIAASGNGGGSNYTVGAFDTLSYSGNQSMPQTGSGTMTGNNAAGYAKVTYVTFDTLKNKNYDYANSVRQFVAPYTGNYKLQVWGAQGGTGLENNSTGGRGGFGGYATGVVKLNKGQTIYIVTGQKGNNGVYQKNAAAAYNGGGSATWDGGDDESAGGGGGATHIATYNRGELANYNSYRSEVLIVAGGGGGGNFSAAGGEGGGYVGKPGAGSSGTGGTQTSGHAFGQGRAGSGTGYSNGVSGGGGGWYGGKTDTTSSANHNAGGGGSGYIGNTDLKNKYMYGYNATTSNDESTKTYSTTNYSSNAVANYAKAGNGYATVTYISYPYLADIKVNGTSIKGYDPEKLEYTVAVPANSSSITLEGVKTESTQTVTLPSDLTLYSITKTFTITSTSQDGSETVTYTINIEKADPRLKSISIVNGQLDKAFDMDTYTYNVLANKDYDWIDISALPLVSTTDVTNGTGRITIPVGKTEIVIKTLSALGNIATYTLNVTRMGSSDAYLKDIKVDGISLSGFDPETLTYTIPVDIDTTSVTLEGIRRKVSQEIYLPGDLSIKTGTTTKEIKVVAEDGVTTNTYRLVFVKDHTSKLKELEFDYELFPSFNPNTTEYYMQVPTKVYSVRANYLAYDEEAVVKITGNGYVKNSTTIKVNVTEPNSDPTVYTIVVLKEEVAEDEIGKTWNFPYNGGVQTFTATHTGPYKLETWGAAGGYGLINGKTYDNSRGGYGAYATGEIYLNKGDVLYIVVGGQGANSVVGRNSAGGYNGGALGTWDNNDDEASGGGGGATHIATTNRGVLSNYNSYRGEVVIVAGGGGGGSYAATGGDGGGAAGRAGSPNGGAGGTQTSGHAFGQGRAGSGTGYSNGVAGAGGGWYGGLTNTHGSQNINAAGGGSGYIGNSKLSNAVMYQYWTTSGSPTTSATAKTVGTTKFSATATTNYAKSGNGYARITALKDPSEDNYLKSLTSNAGTISPEFDPAVQSYTITLADEDSIKINAEAADKYATVSGIGEYDFSSGSTINVDIVVTAENKATRTYKVKVVRKGSPVSDLNNIKINGLIADYCRASDEYCVTNPVQFVGDHYEYSLTIPYQIKSLNFQAIKNNPGQTVSGDGTIPLLQEVNTVTIVSTSEDGEHTSTYVYTITRDMSGVADLKELELVSPNDPNDDKDDIDFDPNITEYKIAVPHNVTSLIDLASVIEGEDYTDVGILKVVPEADGDKAASYALIGNTDFEEGDNTVNIAVTSHNNGNVKTYTLIVYREQKDDVYLRNLEVVSVDGLTDYALTPRFNKLTREYFVTVPNEVASVKINASAHDVVGENEGSVVVSGTGIKNLKTGKNPVYSIMVFTEDCMEVYNVTITREKNDNPRLSNIVVKDPSGKTYPFTEEFSPDKIAYTVAYENDYSTIEFDVTPEEPTTTYKFINNNIVREGVNIKKIMAIAEDGTSKTYNIVINKVNVNSNNFLDSIEITNPNGSAINYTLDPEFDKNEPEFTVIMPASFRSGSVKVTGYTEDIKATILGNDTYSINVDPAVDKPGFVDEVTLLVTADNGDTRNYILKFVSAASKYAGLCSVNITLGGDYTMTPDFDGLCGEPTKDIEDYELDYVLEAGRLSDNKINISAVGSNNTVIISGDVGEKTLRGESSVFTIHTVSQDGTSTMDYTFTVNRQLNNNTNITKLDIPKSINHSSEILTSDKGAFELPENAISLSKTDDWVIELEDSNATYSISGDDVAALAKGRNVFVITVTAENGSTKPYEVIVNRQNNREGYYLSSLSVDKGELDPEFDRLVDTYEVLVGNDVDKINVDAISETFGVEVDGVGEHELEVGWNYIKLTLVDDLDNPTEKYKTYFVNVFRSEATEARLSRLEVKDTILNPAFDKDTYNYSLTTNNKKLDFTSVVPVDAKATYEITGNQFDTVGNYQVVITVTAADEKTTKEYKLNVNRKINANTYLESLSVDDNEITPEFNKNNSLYYLETEDDIIYINAIPEAETSTVTGDGAVRLSAGVNIVEITVTSEANTTRTYMIEVTKNGNGNNKIKNLIVNNGTLKETFVPTNNYYTITIPYDETEVDMNVILDDSNASYSVIGNSDLRVGDNLVYIKVTAPNGSVNTYNLTVSRERMVSAYLKVLEEANYNFSPKFDKYVNNYKLIVNNETTSLDLTAIPEDDLADAPVIEGNQNFVVGHNEVTITVTRRDSDNNVLKEEVYVIDVERQIPDNSYLNFLYTDQGELVPDFDKDTMRYSIDVDNTVEQIEVFAEASVKSATVTGTGVYDLEPGENEIEVKVTTINNVERTYHVTVNRAKKTGNFLLSLIATSGSTTHVLKHADDNGEGFDKNIKRYVIDVDNDTNNIVFAGRVSDGATVTGLGEYPIYDSGRTVYITVTSEAGVSNTYEVQINRELSDNNNLIGLTPSEGELDPAFMYGETEYNLVLDSSVSKLSFEVELEHQFATVSGHEERIVPNGTSHRTIKVKAENGDEKEYHITVTKEANDNSFLGTLRIEDATQIYPLNEAWEPTTRFTYSIDVPYDKKVLTDSEVFVTTADTKATVEKTPSVNLSTQDENKYLIIVTARDGITTSTYTVIVNRAKNDDSALASLDVNFGMVKEPFNPETTEYTWKVPYSVSKITKDDFTYTLSDPNASAVVTEDITLVRDQTKTITIIVTSENGLNETRYKLNVSYDEMGDATLQSLSSNKGMLSPTFDRDTYKYDLYLFTDEEDVTLTAVPSQSTSQVISGDGLITLTKLNTTNNIIVQAQNGMTETYVVNIHRNISTATDLRDIRLYDIDEYELDPKFKAGEYSYTIDVPYEYDVLSIEGIKSSGQQSIKYIIDGEQIDNYCYELPLDDTTVTLEVYNGFNEKTSTYTVVINRQRNTNNYLSDLSVDGYTLTPSFSREIQEYKIMVDMDVTSVDVAATKEFAEATLTGTGTHTIDYGSNKIKVTVTSQAGVDRDYIIDIKKGGAYIGGITIDSDDIGYEDEKYEYDYDTKKNSVEVVITKKDASQVITSSDITLTCDTSECRGVVSLAVGNNEVKFNASAYGGGLTEEYTLNINRMSDDTTLKELSVDKGRLEPDFSSNVHTYDLYEYEDETDINITAVPNSDTAKGITGDGNVVISGSDVDITHQIVVEAENGSKENPYTINIHKTIIRNPKILNLGLNGLDAVSDACFGDRCTLSPSFQANGTTRTYSIKVPNGYTNLDVLVQHSTDQQSHKLKIDGEYVENYTLPLGVTAVEIELYDGFDVLYDTYTLNVERLASDNNYLSSMMVSSGTLSPTFNKTTNEYSIDVSGITETLNITAIAEAASLGATVSGDGTVNLNMGKNNVDIVVTSPSGIENTYTIVVHRGTPKLGAIKIDGTDVYVDGTTEYEYTTKKSQIPIEILFADTVTTIISTDMTLTHDSTGYRDLNVSLNPGMNTITFRNETSSGGQAFSETYTLSIYREDDDATLKSLIVAKGKFDQAFDPEVESYDVYEYLDETDDTITAVANSNASATTIIGDGLVTLDSNEVTRTITVTAENGNTKSYTITFHKTAKRNPHVLDMGLNGLDATGVAEYCIDGKCELTPSFSENKSTYSIKVPYEYEDLDIYVEHETSDEYHKIIIDDTEITSTYPLPVGTTLATVEVYDGLDKLIYTYMVVVQKGLSDNALLADLDIENYGIPSFDPETKSYSIVVPATTSEVNVIATPGITGQTITGDGNRTLNMGVNTIEVKVKSPSGVKDNTYTITVTRASAELNSVEINEEVITPEIGTGYYKYEIATDEIKIQFNKKYIPQEITTDGVTYTCDDEKCYATVPLVVGENTFVGHVDYAGVTKDYTLKITRVKSNNAIVTDIRPSTGTIAPLYPSFDNDIKGYTITIYDETINDISFEVDVDNKYATVTGNETTSIDYGTKSITIVVTAEDGVTKNTFTIDVTKIKLIKDLVVEESVKIAPGDEYDLVYNFVPEDTDQTAVTFEVTGDKIITVDENGHIVSDGTPGFTEVTITSVDDPSISKVVPVTVLVTEITSSVYEIRRDVVMSDYVATPDYEKVSYVRGIQPDRVTVGEFVTHFDNDPTMLFVYDLDDNRLDDEDELVGTAMKLKLVFNDVVYDELYITVFGDYNGDGIDDAIDVNTLNRYLLYLEAINDVRFFALDVNDDGSLDPMDSNLINKYLLYLISEYEGS